MSNIQFSTKGLGSSQNSLYEVEKFNGADYTTTPTAVDETRAIDVSNYLPEGNGLVKRNGVSNHINMTPSGVYGYNISQKKITEIKNPLMVYKAKNGSLYLFYSESFQNVDYLAIKFYTTGEIEETDLGSDVSYGNSNYITDHPQIANITKISVFENSNGIYFFTGEGYYVIKEVVQTYTVGGHTVYVTHHIYYHADRDVSYQSTLLDSVYVPLITTNIPSVDDSGKSLTLEQPNLLTPNVRLSLNYIAQISFTGSGNEITGSTLTKTYDLESYMPSKELGELTKLKKINGKEYNNTNFTTSSEHIVENATVDLIFKADDGFSTTQKVSRDMYYYPSSSANDDKGKFKVAYSTVNGVDYSFLEEHSNWLTQDTIEIELEDANTSNVISTCDNAIFYDDKIFVSKGNVMYHSLTPNFPKDNECFTYFGSDTYQTFGNSASKIIATGILNNGNMLVIKESEQGKTNIYIRHKEYRNYVVEYNIGDAVYQYNKTEELYPITQAGIDLECDENTKVIQYDNKVIISAKKGIYYVNVEASTASQTYNAYELSYMIRNDLSDDLSVNALVIIDGQLWVSRKCKDGEIRVYAADKDRYTFVDGKMQYEWWALDGIYAEEFYFSNALYYCDYYNKALCNYGIPHSYTSINDIDYTQDQFEDAYRKIITQDSGGITFTGETDTDEHITVDMVYVVNNEGTRSMVLHKTDLSWVIPDEFSIKTQDVDYVTISLPEHIKNTYDKQDYLDMKKYSKLVQLTRNGIPHSSDYDAPINQIYPTGGGIKHTIEELYYIKFQDNTEVARYRIEDCELVDDKWYYTANNHFDLLGDKGTISFCYMKLSGVVKLILPYYLGFPEDFEDVDFSLPMAIRASSYVDNFYRDVDFAWNNTTTQNLNLGIVWCFEIRKPVKTYWKSKYTDLGATEVLKSTSEVYFVPETRRGGAVSIGYKTAKREKDFSQRKIILARISEEERNQIELGRYSFDDVDFTDFHFETDTFAHIYSCRRKVKNFAFIQFKFYSDEPKDSTIVKFAVKYHKTRDSRGAR